MHQIRERLGLGPRPRWGSLQRSRRPPSWIWLGSRRAPTKNVWSITPFSKPWLRPCEWILLIDSAIRVAMFFIGRTCVASLKFLYLLNTQDQSGQYCC